ncbi:MAG: glycosyltransferase family 2 protein [Candidatus Edwardsbacteria bacterium]
MKVSGFSIVRHAIKFDYPVVEAITSLLPLCDEFVIAVGNSEDETLGLIKSINSPKVKIIETIWDDNLREGGRVLAVETDKAFSAISGNSDWAFYIQADEVIHEKYHTAILEAMKKWKDDERVEGLLFNYLHFYGSYDYIGDSRRWYKREIRVVRNDRQIRSFRDAQGFRKNNRLLHVKPIDAFVYHYGWVKPPELQQSKQQHFHKLWHDDEWLGKNISKEQLFDYSKIDSLERFTGTHPAVMQERIRQKNWEFNFDLTKKNFPLLKRLLYQIERKTDWRIGEYRNFKIIRN